MDNEKSKQEDLKDQFYERYKDRLFVLHNGVVVGENNIYKLAFHDIAHSIINGFGGIHYDRFTQNLFFRSYNALSDKITYTAITKKKMKAIYTTELSVLKGADFSSFEGIVNAYDVQYSDDAYNGEHSFDSLSSYFSDAISNTKELQNVIDNYNQVEEPGNNYLYKISDVVKFENLTEEENELVIKYILISCKALAENKKDKNGKPIQPSIFPVLNGDQGIGKSRFCKLFAFNDDKYFIDNFDFNKSEEDLYRLKNSRWIVEVGEMKGFEKKNIEKIKAFLTGRTQQVRKLYTDNDMIEYQPRQYYFLTTNKIAFLNDVQNRRFISLKMPILTDHQFELIEEFMPYFYARCDVGSFFYDDYYKLERQVLEIANRTNKDHINDSDILEVLEVAENFIYKYGFVKTQYIKSTLKKVDPYIIKDLNNVLQLGGFRYKAYTITKERFLKIYNDAKSLNYKAKTFEDIAIINANPTYRNIEICGDVIEYQRVKEGKYNVKCFCSE